MARLPGVIDVGAPRGARPSGATVRPTDFGLSDLAGAVGELGQALSERDDQDARKILDNSRAPLEAHAGELAAKYDGAEPGFANMALAAFDNHFTAVAEDHSYSSGVRFALRQRLDEYRANFGTRMIGVETDKRAGIIADQERAKLGGRVTDGEIAADTGFQTDRQARFDAFDGSDPHFLEGVAADFDRHAKEQVDAADARTRPILELRLNSRKASAMAQALEYQQQTHLKVVQQQTLKTVDALANTVMSNPTAYTDAVGALPNLADSLPAPLRAPFLRQTQGTLAAYRIDGLIQRGDFDQATAELGDGRYDKVLDPKAKNGLIDAVKARSAKLAGDLIEAMRYGGDVNADALSRAVKNSGDPGLKARADWVSMVGGFEGEALGSIGGGGSKKGFAEAADFIIELEGGDATIRNDNGRGVSRFGINQSANPDLDVANLTRGQAVARYRKYWAAVGGSQLQPGLAVAAFDAAVLMGPEKARRFLAESGGDAGMLIDLEKVEMNRLAQAEPAKYGDDLKGWMNRAEKVRAEAARRQAFANVQDGLATDPIKFALGGSGRAPLANVAPLPDEPSGPAFASALQQRQQLGAMMVRQYRAPFRMLTDGEAAQFKDAIARDPTKAVEFAEEATAAVGPAAARAMLGELGQKGGEAAVTLHLADLTAAGLGGYARNAARGLALKGEGAELEKTRRDEIRGRLEDIKSVFAGQPELRLAAEQTAEAAMLADQQAGKPMPAAYYVAGALGASVKSGRVFGGVTQLNGAATLIPAWLSADHADDALEVMAAAWASTGRGPVYTNGAAVGEADLRRARLQLMPNGHYLILDRQGRALQAKGGRPFTFDWDDAQGALRNRLGEKVVGK